MGKRLSFRLLQRLAFASAAVLLFLGTAAPALADDGPKSPSAAAAPRDRPAPSGKSFNELISYANDSARDLAALQQHAREVASARNATYAEMSMLAALTERPSALRDRLEREALRLSTKTETPSDAALPAAVRDAADELRTLRVQLEEQYVALAAEAEALAPYSVIGPATREWTSPARGWITQGFGPVDFWLEPSRTYGGVFYPHFHDGVDIGAKLDSPVVAAAPGRVIFVGHLPDGAMVVLIAHTGGLVSLYAHLDDAIAPPRVQAGDDVQKGEIIGAIGLTGVTTGPHLHFSVWRDGELIDPLSLIAP